MNRRIFIKMQSIGMLGFLCFDNSLESQAGQIDGPKRIYIALDDHTDYMWSGNEQAYQKAFLDTLDYYIDSVEKTKKTEPPEFQNRFTCDGYFWIYVYKNNRTPEQFQRLAECIRSGHISVPLTVLTLCYGAMPAEAVIRSMYYAGVIERQNNLRLPLAAPMEDQTMPFGVSSLWAGAGAKYCWMGICGCVSRAPFEGKRTHDIYWWTGLDKSRILTKWNTFSGDNMSLGGYAEARKPVEAIKYVITDKSFKKNYPYDVIGIFGKGWDDLSTMTEEFITVAKKETTEKLKVIVSNEIDFFKDFETAYGKTLPSFSASFGNEWDLYTASMSELTARVKRSVEKLRSAEALATLVSLKEPGFMTRRKAEEELAFINMGLYWTHSWTTDGNTVSHKEFIDWARRTAGQVEQYVDTLQNDAVVSLGKMIRKKGDFLRFYVFNPLGFNRTDIAEYEYNGDSAVHVVDLTTGLKILSQIVTEDGIGKIRIIADEIPAFGYKVYEIRPGAEKVNDRKVTVNENIIENDFYGIKVSGNGSISSLIDKKHNNRELVRNIDGRSINDLGDGQGVIEIEQDGPLSSTLIIHSSAPLKHITRITLYHQIDRISIRNEITENFSSEGDFPPQWAFSFDIHSPDIWHEEIGAVIRARLLDNGGHYSPVHARYDWLTLNHFADINDSDGYGVTISNEDCCFMKTGKSGFSYLDTETPQINILAGGQIDGPKLGIPSQGGDSYFLQRFALKTHTKFSKTDAMRFALEHQNPFVCGVVSGGDSYPETSFSFIEISDPAVLIWALKPRHDGIDENGIVARLWNMEGNQSDCKLSFPHGKVTRSKELTHIETAICDGKIENGNLIASLSPYQMKTYGMTVLIEEKM